ncbi:Frizzled-5 [Amphibalanus amphitrite]|uniref:Frizzled-5 n=1 Tax=Amphibalanus amphitrite TaxID=1232801 RepID=A0A6A4WCE7_AMPAM|nr:Frizzled-5 [Amphibalanus amphitrite]
MATWLFVLLVLSPTMLAQEPPFQCQKITIAMCRKIGYNVTMMPNQFYHDTQEEAGLEFFLCATYVPICLESHQRTIPVCRSVCERARAGCEPFMMTYDFTWPERLNCDRLPEYMDPENLCMDNKNGQAPPPPRRPQPPPPCSCKCERPRAVPLQPGHRLFNRTEFTERWVLSWAVLCAVSTAVTVATFLIDRSRFQYPERPIIFLAACYFMVSVGYLVRLGAGHELTACDGDLVRYDAAGGPGRPAAAALCTVVFLLVYFFGMASAVWWVVLSLTCVIKQDRGNRDKLEKLMFRIGVFSVLYTVPASVVIACLVYEQHQRPAWERRLVCPCEAEQDDVPNFHLFLLRYFMSLAVGVTSIIWVWSRKTLHSWCVLLGCRRPPAPAPLARRYEAPTLQSLQSGKTGSGLPATSSQGPLMQVQPDLFTDDIAHAE